MQTLNLQRLATVVAVGTALLSSSTFAQDSGGAVLEEIVITAQKRTEKLEDVPVAAAVVSSDTLISRNVSDISDINNVVPSVNMNGTINGRVPMGIRGISSVSNEGTVGINSGVAIMIDGVSIPSDSFAGNAVEDIQNVEVLKGPQQTLGGRAAAAGVINMVTRGPRDTLTGSIGATATDDKEYRLNGFIAGPISNTVKYSLSAYGSTREYPITNTETGKKTSQDGYGARGKLLFNVTDDFDITLMAHHAKTTSKGFNFVYSYVTPGSTIIGSTQAVALPGITPGLDNQSYRSPVTTAGSTHTDDELSLNLDYRLGGDYTLSSTTAYQHEKQRQIQDLFAVDVYFWNVLTPNGPPFGPYFYNTQSQDEVVTQTSEELKLVSGLDQPVSFVTGIYYSDSKVDETYVRTLAPAGYNVRLVPETTTYDLYGRATWKFLPSSSLVMGLRYNHDVLKYRYDEIKNVVTPFAEEYGPLYSTGASSSNAVIGDISFQQQLAENSMAYLSYARGYAPAAYNTSAILYASGPNQLTPVDQEHIDHFELGSKGTYLDRRLTLNTAVFYTVYKNYQIQSYSSAKPGQLTPPLELKSVGQASTKGVEVDLNWLATNTLKVNLNAAYIDAKFDDYKGAPCWGSNSDSGQQQTVGCSKNPVTGSYEQDVSGKTMPNSPKFKGVIGLEQRVPLSGRPYELVVGGTYTYRTSAQMLPDQNPYAILPAFGLLNLSAGLQQVDGKYSITLFVNNVTDKHYFVDMEDFWTGPWGSVMAIGQPARDAHRYIGIRFNAGF